MKSPTNEYVAILTFTNVSDPTALRDELLDIYYAGEIGLTGRGTVARPVDSGNLNGVQVEPIVPHCGHGIN